MRAQAHLVLSRRNVSRMVDETRLVLDTPSKKTLWAYILPRMPLEHRDYVLRIVDLPKQQILGELHFRGCCQGCLCGNCSCQQTGQNTPAIHAGIIFSVLWTLPYTCSSSNTKPCRSSGLERCLRYQMNTGTTKKKVWMCFQSRSLCDC